MISIEFQNKDSDLHRLNLNDMFLIRILGTLENFWFHVSLPLESSIVHFLEKNVTSYGSLVDLILGN